MALYDFVCPECGHEFEVIQRMDAPNPECPECGCGKTEKLLTAAASVEFRGDGYYRNGKHTW